MTLTIVILMLSCFSAHAFLQRVNHPVYLKLNGKVSERHRWSPEVPSASVDFISFFIALAAWHALLSLAFGLVGFTLTGPFAPLTSWDVHLLWTPLTVLAAFAITGSNAGMNAYRRQ